MEILGISPLWLFAFPLVVATGYTVVLISAHRAMKGTRRPEKKTGPDAFDA